MAGHLVATFRASVAADADDWRTTELVNELSARDARFRELWAGHDVANDLLARLRKAAHPD